MSRPVTLPLVTAPFGEQTLRFFRAPGNGPRLPWHSQDDLFACLGMSRGLRRSFRQQLVAHPRWREDVLVVATPDDITTIAPHSMAQGLIDAMIGNKATPFEAQFHYLKAGKIALDALTSGMTSADALAYTMVAVKTEIGEILA